MVFSSQGKAEKARTFLLGQVHAEKHNVRPRNRLNTQISCLFLISHCLDDFSQSNA
jgi:hypothetical protein